MNKLRYSTIASAASLLLCPIAIAQTSDQLAKCRALDGDASRLACYDQIQAQQPAPSETPAPDETGATSPQASQQSWTGTGIRNLPPFTATGPWTLHWQSADQISIYVKTSPGEDVAPSDIASSSDGNSDSSYETITGPIYLSVNGSQAWGVWVTPAQ